MCIINYSMNKKKILHVSPKLSPQITNIIPQFAVINLSLDNGVETYQGNGITYSRTITPVPMNNTSKNDVPGEIIDKSKPLINYDTIVINERIIRSFKEKYYVTLKFVNNILTNSNLNNITDLIQFVDIDRQLIIVQKNADMMDTMLSEIYHYFGKRECQYGQKDKTKYYIVTILKNMCKQLTLSLKGKSKNVQKDGFVKSYILYTISYR